MTEAPRNYSGLSEEELDKACRAVAKIIAGIDAPSDNNRVALMTVILRAAIDIHLDMDADFDFETAIAGGLSRLPGTEHAAVVTLRESQMKLSTYPGKPREIGQLIAENLIDPDYASEEPIRLH